MKLCKTCGKELQDYRRLGQLKDFCSIGCSNSDSALKEKRITTSKETRKFRKTLVPDRTLFLSREELKTILCERSSSQGISLHSSKNLSLKPEILFYTAFLSSSAEWSERVFCVKHDIMELPKCEYCENVVSFAQNSIGYFRFCSRTCSAQSDTTKLQRAKTNIKTYGDAVAFKNNTVKNRQKDTLLQRYGVTNSWHLAKHNGISKISQELFWNVWQNSKQYGDVFFGELNGELRLLINDKLIKPDYAQIDADDKRIIEFDGSYWHNRGGAEKRDLERDDALKAEGWKILRIAEEDYLKDKLEITIKCIAFVNRDVDY